MNWKIIKVKGRADRIIRFIECLIVPSGRGAGKNFKLSPFQKKFIRAIYEPHSLSEGEKKRIVANAILSMARKNGKTALIACLLLAHLIGPEAILNNEIYSAANDKEQAAIVYNMAAQIIRADPELSVLCRCIDSRKRISCYSNGSIYQALSREAGTKHGANPGLVIYDELAQAKDMELFEVLDSSMGARFEPLMIVISTQSKDPQHILSQMIDDGINSDDPTIVCHLYAVPDEIGEQQYCSPCNKRFTPTKKTKGYHCPSCGEETVAGVYDPHIWKLANPALGKFLYTDYVRGKADRAKRLPSFENSFMNLHLNMRVDAQAVLISRKDWVACLDRENTIQPGEDIYLALDLSKRNDLTALVAISANDGDRVKSWFWKPEATLFEHQKRDRAPYDKWAKEGHLITTPGKVILYDHVAKEIAEIGQTYNIIGLAFDRWRMDVLIKELQTLEVECYSDDEGQEGLRLIGFGQGYTSMAPAIEELENSIINGTFYHDGNPVLTWNFSNAVALSDAAGNRKLDKQKARFRIDGAVATVMAKGLKARDMLEPTMDIDDFINNSISVSI